METAKEAIYAYNEDKTIVDVSVHPTSTVEKNVLIGKNTKIWHYAHVREDAKIGENCNLGKDVYIDAGVEIGDNTRIQNGVSVFKGVKIEENVFLGPHMTFTNDLYPRAGNDGWNITSTLVKKGAAIGANATIISGVTIGEFSMIGAGSVVTKDVPAHGLVYGNPARLRGFVCYCGNKLTEKLEESENQVLLLCGKCFETIGIEKEIYNRLRER